jgi:hypothetical protein
MVGVVGSSPIAPTNARLAGTFAKLPVEKALGYEQGETGWFPPRYLPSR